MLDAATAVEPDVLPGRFAVATRRRGRSWAVIVEPDEAAELLVVVTAYPVG